jgi:non-ribosomal peptide synthetase component F
VKIETNQDNETRAGAPTASEQWICVPQLVAQQAQARPEAIAIVSGSEALTYAELDRRANQLAHYLKAQGILSGLLRR